MIFYFSGTGNSSFVAHQLAEYTGEATVFIFDEFVGFEGESLGFVFPVYAWGIAPEMMQFIDSLPDSFWNDIKIGQRDIWAVMTYGDEAALAPEMLKKLMSRKGVTLSSVWGVTMPNTYVLLPGFDVDPVELEKEKIRNAQPRIKEIAEGIRNHRSGIDVVRGSLPWLKTRIVYPLFKKWGISPNKWFANDRCIGCGICEKSCPLKNIHLIERVPEWGDKCCSCLACYHHCPEHAIGYGNVTTKKGQYFFNRKK